VTVPGPGPVAWPLESLAVERVRRAWSCRAGRCLPAAALGEFVEQPALVRWVKVEEA
jgi:hypothetical protein